MNQDEQITEIISYYSSKPDCRSQENIIHLLREIQDVLGCIPRGIIHQAAHAIHEKPAVLEKLVTLYPSLKFANYKHRIVVCTGQRCSSHQSADLYKALCKILSTDKEGLSADGAVLLCTQNCLKHCQTAPNIMLDGVLYPHMTVASAQKLVTSLL